MHGELTVQAELEVPEQPFKTEYNEVGIPTTFPLDFKALLCYGDGTPLPNQPVGWSGGRTTYHGNVKAELALEQETLDELRQNGQIALEVRITDVVFDGK